MTSDYFQFRNRKQCIEFIIYFSRIIRKIASFTAIISSLKPSFSVTENLKLKFRPCNKCVSVDTETVSKTYFNNTKEGVLLCFNPHFFYKKCFRRYFSG